MYPSLCGAFGGEGPATFATKVVSTLTLHERQTSSFEAVSNAIACVPLFFLSTNERFTADVVALFSSPSFLSLVPNRQFCRIVSVGGVNNVE